LHNLAAGTLVVFLSPFSTCQAKYYPKLSDFISPNVFPPLQLKKKKKKKKKKFLTEVLGRTTGIW